MALTLTEQLDNLYTTTWYHMKSDAVDNIFDATPFWAWMRDGGRMEEVSGGRFLTEPLEYDKNELVSWIGKGGTVQMNDFEHLTIARYDWRYLVASIVRFGVDDQQNRGRMQIINLLTSKLNNTQNALADELETRLFGGDAAADLAFDGLQHLVPDDPTSASNDAGEIDPSTYTWWRNQATNMTGESFAAFGVRRMRTMMNNCRNNKRMDAPNILITGQSQYERYEDAALDYYRIQNNRMAELGFENQQFKGTPMVWSPSCGDRMYFLNTRFLKLKYDPYFNFDMTEWKAIPNQVHDRAAQIILACSLVTSRRRTQGVIYNMTVD